MWVAWPRRLSGGHVGRLCVWAVPIFDEAPARSRTLVLLADRKHAFKFLLQGAYIVRLPSQIL